MQIPKPDLLVPGSKFKVLGIKKPHPFFLNFEPGTYSGKFTPTNKLTGNDQLLFIFKILYDYTVNFPE
jgi:hypothetical protein